MSAKVRFTHTYTQMCMAIRNMREFRHLLGRIMECMSFASDMSLWTDRQRNAYEAALPCLLWNEDSIRNTERVLTREGMIKPRGMARRVAYIFGVECVCGSVYSGYQALPISCVDDNLPLRSDDKYRHPFCSELISCSIEPLCPRCKPWFRRFCDVTAGLHPSADAIELCAIGWLAGHVKVKADRLVQCDRAERQKQRIASPKAREPAQNAEMPTPTKSEATSFAGVRLASINFQPPPARG